MKENGSPYKSTVRFWYIVYWIVAKLSIKFRLFQTKTARAGEIAAWTRYLQKTFGDKNLQLYSDKDKLRSKLFSRIAKDEKVIVMELGVAYGKGSKWIINSLGERLLEFHGFDLFSGLPRQWRGLKAGHFSTNGASPKIEDPRVSWHIGNVENTLEQFLCNAGNSINEIRMERLVILFDLDILEPTAKSYELLKLKLKKGDLIHFDEAFDAENELIVLHKFLQDFKVEFIGFTSEAACFEILSEKVYTEL